MAPNPTVERDAQEQRALLTVNVRRQMWTLFHPIGRKNAARWGLLAAGAVSVVLAAFLLYRSGTQGVLATEWPTGAMFGVFGLALLVVVFFAPDRFVKRLISWLDA